MSIRAYAKYIGVSDAAVRKAIETGRISTTHDGKIDPAIADVQWCKNTNTTYNEDKKVSDTSNDSYRKSRAMRMAYEAALKKLEYEEKSGKLISAAQVESDAFAVARIHRDKMMRIPFNIAPRLVNIKDPQKIEDILTAEFDEFSEEFVEELTKITKNKGENND
ncbi:MAG: hypothetical protein LBL75_00655 [Rickettsiales bacterium]|nr:hypothetical protein [Rickettsiales bacterium]